MADDSVGKIRRLPVSMTANVPFSIGSFSPTSVLNSVDVVIVISFISKGFFPM
jgi:hypothetical protein